LTPSDLESCVVLENACFPPQLAASRDSVRCCSAMILESACGRYWPCRSRHHRLRCHELLSLRTAFSSLNASALPVQQLY
jgi:hypothetical protein